MSILRSLAVALAAAAFAVACSSETATAESNSGFPVEAYASVAGDPASIELRTAPQQPPMRGEVKLELRLTDSSGAPRDGLTIDVVPWMPSHGHGANGKPTVTPLGGGAYRVDGCALTMAGTWQLKMQITGPNGLVQHAAANVEVR